MRFEEAAEGVGEWVGAILRWLGGAFGGGSGGGAVYDSTHVGREGGIGGCSSDGDGDTVAESGAGVVSDDAAGCASSGACWDHSHQLTGDASCACSGSTLAADCAEYAGQFEED